MPVHDCHENDKPGYQWGNHGKCYTYTPGDKSSMESAHSKAESQGRAAYAHGYRGSEEVENINKKLPDINSNEDEQTYVSRCIEFETNRSPDRPKDQIAKMCYEKYRSAKKSGDSLEKLANSLNSLSVSLEQLKNTSNLEPKYYSTAKPFYRFELSTLEDELVSSHWNDKKLLIDIKYDGLRLSLGKINGKGFCYVDPETLKEKSPDVSDRLPLIIKELESFPDNIVIDGEFIAVEGDEVLHRTTANSILNAIHFDPDSLSKIAHAVIFDVLFFNGQDIRNQPLHERLEYLGRLKSTDHIWIAKNSTSLEEIADGYIVDGSNFKEVSSTALKIFESKHRPSFIAEGAMIKDINHPYEVPQNHGWGKLKRFYEVDAVVWNKKLVKGQDDVWNYFLGISVSQEYYDHLPNNIKVPNKLYANFGKTDNTKVKAEAGDVIRVASEEVLKTENNGFPYYRGYINRVLELISEKNISDSLEVLDKLSSFQPKRMTMEEIERINKDSPLTQEDIYTPSGQSEKSLNAISEGDIVICNGKYAIIKKILDYDSHN